MYIVTLTYTVGLDRIDQALPDHMVWLEKGYAGRVFIASGRRTPRVGGVILAAPVERSVLEDLLQQDPLAVRGYAEYDIVEFEPTTIAAGIELEHRR